MCLFIKHYGLYLIIRSGSCLIDFLWYTCILFVYTLIWYEYICVWFSCSSSLNDLEKTVTHPLWMFPAFHPS